MPQFLTQPAVIAAIIGAIATITAAFIGGRNSGRIEGKKRGLEEGRKQKELEIDDAPRMYVENLAKLINIASREDIKNAVRHARAIVSTRNDLRDSMMNIASLLNSDIDVLARQIGDGQSFEETRPQTQVYETLQVLALKWPAKKDQVEIELRKLLAEIGILGRAPNRPGPNREDRPRRRPEASA